MKYKYKEFNIELLKISKLYNNLTKNVFNNGLHDLFTKIENNRIVLNFEIYRQEHSYFDEPTSAEKIKFVLNEIDYPVSIEHGKEFCEFWEFTEKNKTIILNACANVNQYQSYLDYENSQNDY